MAEFKRAKVISGFVGTQHENRVAFQDPSTVHGPDGAFVYGDKEYEVAVTPEVLDAVRHGRLTFVDAPADEPIPEEIVEMTVSATDGAEEQAEDQDKEAEKKSEDIEVKFNETEPAPFSVVPPGESEKRKGRK